MFIEPLLKILLPAVLSFVIGILITPVVADNLYKHKAWKRKLGKGSGLSGGGTPVFDKLRGEQDLKTPRMGGLIIVLSLLITTILVWIASNILGDETSARFDFVSRTQTWVPLFAFVTGAAIGILDDIFTIKSPKGLFIDGIPFKYRIIAVSLLSTFIGYWFFDKLEMSSINLMAGYSLELGLLFVPFFVLVSVATFSGGIIDGVDGLSGGVFAHIFTAFSMIAFMQFQYDIAALCAAVVGAVLAFLWFNIPPARFYMTEAGSVPLTLTLVVIGFLTDQVFALIIVALPLYITVASVVIQGLSKKYRGKKIFLAAPIHHHFEALGWPNYKVSMRYWIVSAMCAVAGIIIAFI